MEHVLAVHTVTQAAEHMAGIVIESNSEDTENKLLKPSKTIVKWTSDMRSKIAHVLADVGAMAKVDTEEIIENRMNT